MHLSSPRQGRPEVASHPSKRLHVSRLSQSFAIMSSIDKMSIMGIRSFKGGGHAEAIQIFTPLTLVVGVNGSGKTTIIECLKYVLTGLTPPNTKAGGAFIHDPQLTGDKELLAQVKISFKSTQGYDLVATRNLQLTVKKTARSMKTLECALKMRRNGEVTTVSSRVVEMDQILPQYLGVSTAVIDNVIFCHQEESLWPMSDSSTLKKKFDEIFEAQKYMKAIKNIKDIGKEKKQQLGEYKIHEQNAKIDKDRARKAEKRSVGLRDEIESLRERVGELGRQMKKAHDLANTAWSDSEEFSRVLGQLEGKRIEARGKQSTIDDLKINLKEMSESDEWLESTLEQFDARQKELTSGMKTKQEQYVACTDQIKDLRTKLDVKLAARGKFQQEKEEHERQVVRRKKTIRDTAAKHEMRGFDDLTDERLVEEFLFRIRKTLKDQQKALDNAKREHDTGKRDAQSLVNKLSEKKSSVQESKIAAKRQMALNDREANEYQKKVNDIKSDEGNKAVIESRIEELAKKITKGRGSAESAGWEKKLKDANSELRDREDDSERLNKELVQGTRRAGEMARLAHLKQELKERDTSRKTLLSAHSERISSALGRDWNATTVSQVHQDSVNSASGEVASAERERDAVTRGLEQIQFKQKAMRESLAKKTATVTNSEEKIRKATGNEPSDYEQDLLDAQAAAAQARGDTKGSKQLHDYFVQILNAMDSPKPACRVCQRGFKSKEDPVYLKMKTKVETIIKDSLKEIEDVEADESENKMTEMLDLKVSYETWKMLTESEIPAMRKDLQGFDQERESVLAEIEKRDNVVSERQHVKKELEAISKTVASLSQCENDIKTLTSQVEDLSAKESQHAGGRTLDDIQEEISKATDKVRDVKKVITRLTMEQDQSRSDMSSMELALRDLKGELSTANFQLEKKASLVARVEEFKAQNQKQREAVDKADKDIEQIEPQISTATTKYDDIVQRADAEERELSLEVSRLSESVQGLDMMNEQIQAYVNRGGDNQLSGTDREIKNYEEEVSSVTTEQGRLAREVNKINDQIKDSDATRRQYADNLRYRRSSKALQQLSTEIGELESHNAEADRDRLKTEADKWTKEHQKLSAKQAGHMGEMRSKDAELEVILKDFETDYMDAPQRYKEAHIKVETMKAAVEDLSRYGGALDKAIMKYHSLKMDEINETIDELWQNTYQGSDVDTIMIKAENDTSGASNRTYNYRVVMVKQGTAMDMRGRCSAGQKVLASIIIRLALADCFSANCGLIALDEPTTNLDRDNIEALARSLHGIIQRRQKQANFQLIIITHDEDFLRHMQCGDFADHYYRVSRDGQANSQIEMQSIAEVL